MENLVTHINIPGMDGKIYCYAKDATVDMKENFKTTCKHCRYFDGTAQGKGIECLYKDDKAKSGVITVRPKFNLSKQK